MSFPGYQAPAQQKRQQTRQQAAQNFEQSVFNSRQYFTPLAPAAACPRIAWGQAQEEASVWQKMSAILKVPPGSRTHQQKQDLRQYSEQLGELAAECMLAEILTQKNITYDDNNLQVFSGANTFNMVYEDPRQGIVVLEAKGGNSQCGYRNDPLTGQPVRQGTAAYLVAEASVMASSQDPVKQAAGQRILNAMGKNPPKVLYAGVRAPYKRDGSEAYDPEFIFRVEA